MSLSNYVWIYIILKLNMLISDFNQEYEVYTNHRL